jgi:hypothetical protein
MSKLNAEHRRALAMLADAADGCTEAVLMLYGFKYGCIFELVDAGLATRQVEHVGAGNHLVDVTRVRITIAGRVTLAEGR